MVKRAKGEFSPNTRAYEVVVFFYLGCSAFIRTDVYVFYGYMCTNLCTNSKLEND